MSPRSLVLGTRGSALAVAQSQTVADQITAASGWPVRLQIVSTRGDRDRSRPLAQLGGKGLFTLELEEGLRAGELDLAVHSLKDLPTDDPDGLCLGAIPEREDPRDCLVGLSLSALPAGARVGTGSLRRRAQLLALRPDLEVADIRGNVETRLRKRDEGQYASTILASAGMARLGIHRDDAYPFSVEEMVPAVGQGALGVQCRVDDAELLEVLATITHGPTLTATIAERAFLRAYGGGCNVPAACHAWLEGQRIHAAACAERADGTLIRVEATGDDPEALGRGLARQVRG